MVPVVTESKVMNSLKQAIIGKEVTRKVVGVTAGKYSRLSKHIESVKDSKAES